MTTTDMMVEVFCRLMATPRIETEYTMSRRILETERPWTGQSDLDALGRQLVGCFKDTDRVMLTSAERGVVAAQLRAWGVRVHRGKGPFWRSPTKRDLMLRECRTFRTRGEHEAR